MVIGQRLKKSIFSISGKARFKSFELKTSITWVAPFDGAQDLE